MNTTSLEQFYQETSSLIPKDINKEIGHFNVFHIKDTMIKVKKSGEMPYNRRSYYKISLIRGRNKAEYADKVIDIGKNGLLFATPKIPYHYVPLDEDQAGSFCIFTEDFLSKNKSGVLFGRTSTLQTGRLSYLSAFG